MKKLILLLLGFTLVLGAIAFSDGGEDEVEFRCSPPMGISGYSAHLFARIEKPRRLYCPAVTIWWPEGVKSGPREADCEPLPEGEVGEVWSLSDLWPNGVRYQVPPGRNKIVIEFKTSEGFARKECFVEGQG